MAYHLNYITKGKFKEFSKIKEEFEELEDAYEQKDVILQMCEMADLIGAIEGYASTLGIKLDDILKFKDKTKIAFEEGSRK